MFRKSYPPRPRLKRYARNASRFGRGKQIDVSRFINKTAVQKPQEEYVIEHQFSDFPVNDQIKRNIAEKGYKTPTPIQDRVIPLILSGKDVVGMANTGTGKTGAFLIPLINKICLDRSQKVLIITPTRELAVQINEEFTLFAKNMHVFSVLCIGGQSMHNQIYGLRRNHNVVIGTPGRLKDLHEQRMLNFALYNNIVLDEVDRMLDMGFINDITFIIRHLPNNRQSLFFSATIPNEANTLMQAFLRNPVTVSVKSQETRANVMQNIIKVNGRKKPDVLQELLRKPEFAKVLIFGRTKWGMEKLAKMLTQNGFTVAAIHGNKNQNQRQRALAAFKSNHVRILLATDIASRGLDIDDITHVINYDQPASYEDYIHRIGRTGRAEKSGIALTFVD
ncbi:MAG: DEAD/DEAH box helicase [Candidatus Levybacteria bacterium]|nr:DEAD/DEAH box helicase [Candidatus Levybacteria bacterium]